MLLLSAESISKSFGTKKLFTKLSLSIFSQDRIGLIGDNGCGKSTFLKILAGLEKEDSGAVSKRRGLKVGYLPQICEFPDKSPLSILLQALERETHLQDYEKELLAKTWLSQLGFTGKEPSSTLLSGGWKKRLMLAKEMVLSPDLLLLDEPTNHLDLEGIIFLEKFLDKKAPAYLVVSHDRYFLQQSVNRVIEISPAYPEGLFAIEGDFENFLKKKEEFLQGQIAQQRSIASQVRREAAWLASNPKARTTKSKSRIEEAKALFEDFAAIKARNQTKRASIDFSSSERETRKLVVAKNLTKSLNRKLLFKGLDFTLSPGSRIGLMGPNGSGKTTLLRILAGELEPDEGTLKKADNLKIVYFDQHRNALDPSLSLRQALAPNGDFVNFKGKPVHIHSWCKRFLFDPAILDMPITTLSGGERARIAIAHLMLKPADLLLLDEPTNDLDIPTLEALEMNLLDFSGAIVLITHDRFMLDRICNSFLSLNNPQKLQLFATYAQWEASLATEIDIKEEKDHQALPKEEPLKQKLPYGTKKEVEKIEAKITRLETREKELHRLLESVELAQNPSQLAECCAELGRIEEEIRNLYLRWEELS